jgi:hypothetical protein
MLISLSSERRSNRPRQSWSDGVRDVNGHDDDSSMPCDVQLQCVLLDASFQTHGEVIVSASCLPNTSSSELPVKHEFQRIHLSNNSKHHSQHSMSTVLTNSERDVLLSWVPYARTWGYETNTGAHTNYEIRVHGLMHYYALTAVTDLVFRNAMRVRQYRAVMFGDVWMKARQLRTTIEELDDLMEPDGEVHELLTQYFDDNNDFEYEINHMHIFEASSPAFKVMAHAAKALRAIVFENQGAVMDHLGTIADLVEQQEMQ